MKIKTKIIQRPFIQYKINKLWLNYFQITIIREILSKMNKQNIQSAGNEQNKLNINQLVYNIQSKLSLLSQIQQSSQQRSHVSMENKIKRLNKQKQRNQESQINLPMQRLNNRMHQILNSKQSIQNLPMTSEKTNQKKRMQINELQTSTRDIEQVNQQKFMIMAKRSQRQQIEGVNEFNQNNSSVTLNQSSIMTSSKSSSRIMQKFNQIQINYIQKIKTLTFKVSYLQQRLQENQEQKRDILSSLQTYKSLYTRKQQEIDGQVQAKLEEVKDKLVQKFAQQCRLKYNQYVQELKYTTELLNVERNKKKFHQDQNKVLRMQKENLDQMYKSILKKQKQWLRLDIHKTRNQLYSIQQSNKGQNAHDLVQTVHNQQQYSHIQRNKDGDSINFSSQNIIYNTRNNFLVSQEQQAKQSKQKQKSRSKNKSAKKRKDKSTSNSKKAQVSKQKSQKSRYSAQNEILKASAVKKLKKSSKNIPNKAQSPQQMTKQELIPFLAKGIQQLKQKLRMK